MRTTGNINIYDGFNFCTTLEQSKQLLELGLNPETSDMTYLTGIRDGEEVLVRLKNYNYSPRIMFYRKRDKIWVEEGDVYFDCYVDGDDLWTPIPDLEG